MQNGLTAVPRIEVGTRVEPSSSPDFMQTVGASLAYKYNPILDFAEETFRFGTAGLPEEGYSARDNIPEDLKSVGTSLLRATNQEHMDYMVSNLRDSLSTREKLASSGLLSTFAAEAFDPINYISVPLRAAGVAKTALAGGASTAAVVAGQEALRVPFDPLATTQETAINIGSAFVLGGTLSGAVSIPAARRARAIKDTELEIENLRKAIEPLDGVEIDPSIATSAFTDSVLFKAVTTPMKRVLQDEKVPNSAKMTMLEIANDAGILLNANRQGFAIKNSVFQNAKLRDGEWVQTYDSVLSLWGESTGKGVNQRMDYLIDRGDFEVWLTEVDSKAMRGQKPADDFEAKAMDQLNNFYSKWESRLNETGLIGNRAYYERDIPKREARIEKYKEDIRLSKVDERWAKGVIANNERIIASHKATIADFKAAGPINPKNEDIFRPRYWDKDAIRKNRAGLEKVLADWFRENPEGFGRDEKGIYTKVKYSTDPAAIQKRAKDAVDNILGMKDVADVDVATFGYGKSKHMQHRAIDIPNKLVLDYIHKNPVSIMKAYTARTAARYEFAAKFDGLTVDDVLEDKLREMLDSGMSIEEANAVLKDMRHMYDRVAGTVLREPDALNQTVAEVLRTAAQLGYLGAAGVSTITEPAKIMMEHGIGKTMKGLFSVLDDTKLKMGAKEARIAGESLEILMGSSHLRLVEDMGNNPLRSNFMDKVRDVFYTLNGLGPITRIFKDFDGMMRSHTLIDYSVRWSQGKATKMEREYLLRYGIDEFDAKKIAASNWEQSESGLYLANTESWSSDDLLKAAVEKNFNYTRPKVRFSQLSQKDLNNHFKQEFPEATIYTDSEVVIPYFIKLEEEHGYKSLLGFMTDMRDIPDAGFSVHLDKDMIVTRYEDIKTDPRSVDKIRDDAKQALEEGKIKEEFFHHINNELDAIDLFETADDYFEYIMLHELHHSVIQRRVGEDIASFEDRIDKAAIDYIRNQRSSGEELAKQAQIKVLKAEQEGTVKSFRNALSSGIANTILMGTPADKPIITDGVVYIPMRVAKQFGMKEDSKYKGYARIENGLLGLPFQFYSYALAAVNKTTAGYGHGQLKNQFLGTAIAMGLGYTVLELKTPDFVELSFQDKFSRAFDYSGIASLHSDLFYTAMSTTLALGGPNITGGALQPRYPQEPSVVDALTGLGGAGPSIGMEYGRGMANMLTGNVGEGSKEFIRALPFSNLWMWKDTINKYTRMLEDELDDGPSGFGRY